MRLTEQRESIAEARIKPYEEEFYRLLKTPYTENDRWIERVLGPSATKEGYKAAQAFSEAVGRDAAMEEAEALFLKADPLIAALIGTPAKTTAGRAAKVRVLLTCVYAKEEWRGPASELNWEIELTRQVLGEFAGLSEPELLRSEWVTRDPLAPRLGRARGIFIHGLLAPPGEATHYSRACFRRDDAFVASPTCALKIPRTLNSRRNLVSLLLIESGFFRECLCDQPSFEKNYLGQLRIQFILSSVSSAGSL